MVNFEQVKLLETKVAKAIEYVERINREKDALLQRDAEIRGRLSSYQKKESELMAQLDSSRGRIDELEVLVTRFKEDQGKIEESILSTLDQLNRFEKEKGIDEGPTGSPQGSPDGQADGDAPQAVTPPAVENADGDTGEPIEASSEVREDIPDPLLYTPDGDEDNDDSQEKGGELDIF